MSKQQQTQAALDIIKRARQGHEPNRAELEDAIRVHDDRLGSAHAQRIELRKICRRIVEQVEDGQLAHADDITEGALFRFDPEAQKAGADAGAAAREGTRQGFVSVQSQQRRSKAYQAARQQIGDLLAKAAEGKDVTEDEIKALRIADEVSDAELAGFRKQLNAALTDVRERRGDLEQRDGRHQRMRDAAFARDRHAQELASVGVVVDQPRIKDWEDWDRETVLDRIPRSV